MTVKDSADYFGDEPKDMYENTHRRRLRITTILPNHRATESIYIQSYVHTTQRQQNTEKIDGILEEMAKRRRHAQANKDAGHADRVHVSDDKPTTCRSSDPGYLAFQVMMAVIFVAFVGWTTRDSWYNAKPDGLRCSQYDQLICNNGGTPAVTGESFVCTCPNGFYGEHCEEERFMSMLYRWMSALSFRPKKTDALYQEHLKQLTTVRGRDTAKTDDGRKLSAAMTRTRILPVNPRSLYCSPDENMPSLDSVYQLLVSQKRKPGRRSPNVFARHAKIQNALYNAFYQYFVLQFFDDDFNSTVTGSQLYGADERTQSKLRSFVGGKLKTEVLNGEHYPPVLPWSQRFDAVAVTQHWSDRVQTANSGSWWAAIARVYDGLFVNPRRATGHRLPSADPLLFGVSTLWVREHNRVCDELANQWPAWNDEQLYVTAKRTVVAEMMAMMTNDVLRSRENALPATKYEPESWRRHVLNDDSDAASTPFELLLAAMLPENVEDEKMTAAFLGHDWCKTVIDNDATRLLYDLRIGAAAEAAAAATRSGSSMAWVLMSLARENSVQNLNAYRRRFGLGAYESFVELTAGDRDAADALQSLYGHVDRVELVPGMMAERTDDETFRLTAKSFVMNSIMTNPLNGGRLWRPETFGGLGGFRAVESADVRSFVRRNVNKWNDDFFADDQAKPLIYV